MHRLHPLAFCADGPLVSGILSRSRTGSYRSACTTGPSGLDGLSADGLRESPHAAVFTFVRHVRVLSRSRLFQRQLRSAALRGSISCSSLRLEAGARQMRPHQRVGWGGTPLRRCGSVTAVQSHSASSVTPCGCAGSSFRWTRSGGSCPNCGWSRPAYGLVGNGGWRIRPYGIGLGINLRRAAIQLATGWNTFFSVQNLLRSSFLLRWNALWTEGERLARAVFRDAGSAKNQIAENSTAVDVRGAKATKFRASKGWCA